MNDVNDRSQFTRVTSADANGVARTRVKFSNWLQQHFRLDSQKLSDLVLAVNEALANAAEFAYLDTADYGTVACTAVYDEHNQALTVTITDGGRWRPIDPNPSARARPAIRGHGIRLMRRLADELEIKTSEQGTRVSLKWIGLPTDEVCDGRCGRSAV